MSLNWNGIILAAIAAAPPTIAALAARKDARSAKKQSEKNGEDIKVNTDVTQTTQILVNGRMEEMLKKEREKGYSDGLADGLKQALEKVTEEKKP